MHDVSTGATYSTAREAAAARAEALGSQTPSKRRLAAKELIKRISFMRKVYMPVRGNIRLWADLCSAEKHAVKSKAMFAAEPTYEMLCIQLKYDPWRDSLLSAWIMLGRHSVSPAFLDVENIGCGLHQRASKLHAVLVQAVRTMAKNRYCSMVDQLLPRCGPTLST